MFISYTLYTPSHRAGANCPWLIIDPHVSRACPRWWLQLEPRGVCRQTAGRPLLCWAQAPPQNRLRQTRIFCFNCESQRLIFLVYEADSFLILLCVLDAIIQSPSVNIGRWGCFLFIHLSLSPLLHSSLNLFILLPVAPSVPTVTISRSDLPDAWSCCIWLWCRLVGPMLKPSVLPWPLLPNTEPAPGCQSPSPQLRGARGGPHPVHLLSVFQKRGEVLFFSGPLPGFVFCVDVKSTQQAEPTWNLPPEGLQVWPLTSAHPCIPTISLVESASPAGQWRLCTGLCQCCQAGLGAHKEARRSCSRAPEAPLGSKRCRRQGGPVPQAPSRRPHRS